MSKFLTVKEAAKITAKSPSSIRRIIYPILENDKHPDRHHIQPDVATAKSLRVKGENFAWKISEELLRREVPAGGARTTGESKSSGGGHDQSAAIIEMLTSELDIKNQQIAALNETTKSLSERLREGNILMSSLQQHLAITDGSQRDKKSAVDTKSEPEKGSDAAKPKPEKTHWLFRNRRLF